MRRSLSLFIILLTGLLTACAATPTPGASGRPDNTAMVVAQPVEPASLNPLAGYAPDGAAKIFDGLVEHQADGGLRPVLATALPVPAPDARSWTITVRTGLTFSDGRPFGANDVVATYRALLDPAVGSPLRTRYGMLTGVDQLDADTVRFDLAYPYAPFPNLLVLGIMPAVALTPPLPATGPAAATTPPVGVGPYTLVSWTRGQRMVLAANPRYPAVLGGPPAVKKVTVVFIPNDADRLASLREGKLDGAAVAPSQAAAFGRSDEFAVLTDGSADLRAVSLPAHGPVGGDPAIRIALNAAIDRAALVSGPLAGHGDPAYTPMPTVMPEFIEPTATVTYDQTKARDILQRAGWIAGPDGMRARDGLAASITLDYPTGDTLDRDLAAAFVTAAQAVGVRVTVIAVDPTQLAAKAATDATLISAGDPFDPDFALFPLLDSASIPAGGDPSGYADPGVDAALNAGRAQLDPARRAVAYRQFQRAYLANPALVCLVFVQHTYLMRANWTGYQGVIDTTSQGITWGPWWNLDRWVPR